ncbi:biotin--[acetyl-CoA-carboxylase] ligase [Marinobacter mobilis]|uniref:Bifunctional ligase/repressor BirA n=3 Tax=Marinobacter mobilis TaxID=488533 RepID=A0A1H3EAG5_9GAMM|nr:BirA family transcriptional regulator, biotin operon repressor / biotin-[acetyl-CoA-carboxylase] ligase [Marinobacter mobilis]
MMKTKVLVGLLADGAVHSGESLAQQLGISRTAVWKQVRRAVERGIQIETLKGKGYRLVGPVDLLASGVIEAALPDSLAPALDLLVLDQVDSTNAEVIRRRGKVGALPLVCIADSQSAGRGRRGRVWQSPRGENLYISFGLGVKGGFAALDGLSLVFGVALADVLVASGIDDVQLKWPNDVYWQGRKLAGILIELQGEFQEGEVQIVAGMGMNVHMQNVDGIDQPWVSLAQIAPEQYWQRNELAAQLIASVMSAFDEFQSDGFEAFRDRWMARDLFAGELLEATQGDLKGLGRGLASDGSYLIELDDGDVRPVRAGEISLRKTS